MNTSWGLLSCVLLRRSSRSWWCHSRSVNWWWSNGSWWCLLFWWLWGSSFNLRCGFLLWWRSCSWGGTALGISVETIEVSSNVDCITLACKVLLNNTSLWSCNIYCNFVCFNSSNYLIHFYVFTSLLDEFLDDTFRNRISHAGYCYSLDSEESSRDSWE